MSQDAGNTSSVRILYCFRKPLAAPRNALAHGDDNQLYLLDYDGQGLGRVKVEGSRLEPVNSGQALQWLRNALVEVLM